MRIVLPEAMDLNGDGKVTIDELFRSTLLIYAQIVGAVSAVLWGLWVLVAGKVPQPVTFLRVEGAIIAFSVPLAAHIGIKRMLRFERIEEREQKMWELKHEQAKWQFRQAQGIADESGATSMDQATIDTAVWNILKRYYRGDAWTREALEKAGVMTAEVWNEANALLKKRRIRVGRRQELEPETLQEAWAIYLEAKEKANRHKMSSASDPDWREAA